MYFSDDDMHSAMRTSVETLVAVCTTCEDPVHRANAAVALANVIFAVYDRQVDRDRDDVDGEVLWEEEEEDDGEQA